MQGASQAIGTYYKPYPEGLRVLRQLERGRDRLGGTGREGEGRGDIGELFDDLDYFLLLRGYPQKYMPGWHRVFLGSCTIGLGKSLGIQEE